MRLRLSGRAPPPVIIAVPLAGQGSGAGNAGDGAASLKGTWQRRFDPKMESCVGYILTAGASMAPLLEPVLDLAIIFECRDDEGSGVRAKVGNFCYRARWLHKTADNEMVHCHIGFWIAKADQALSGTEGSFGNLSRIILMFNFSYSIHHLFFFFLFHFAHI
ncbi:hypothetical protein QBC42DRAFT_350717 [Cladorrhinum samala]|uniref:Uncharacterized protein n=1 Tax=Cladorrhinum samala TaxID=585594 RepID=A0AAV9H8L8_9PEZI|nr:hypothetical protein QBC42DRAFT_350717 [Cladorrhinum samala]